MRSLATRSPLLGKLDRAVTVENAVATVAYMAELDWVNGKVGAMGFCWGGGLVNQLAVADPNLKAAVAGETYEYTQMYPGMAKTARTEGFNELAEWFETLAKAEKSHAGRFNKGLQQIAGKDPAEAI